MKQVSPKKAKWFNVTKLVSNRTDGLLSALPYRDALLQLYLQWKDCYEHLH